MVRGTRSGRKLPTPPPPKGWKRPKPTSSQRPHEIPDTPPASPPEPAPMQTDAPAAPEPVAQTPSPATTPDASPVRTAHSPEPAPRASPAQPNAAAPLSSAPPPDAAPSSSVPQNVPRFVSAKAAERYKSVRSMKFWPERGFSSDSTIVWPGFVKHVRESRGWATFTEHPRFYIQQLVNEFYANMSPFESAFVIVRGVPIPISPASLNSFLHLTPVVSDFLTLAESPDDELAQRVLQRICIDGAQWKLSKGGARSLLKKDLRPEANVWYHFVHHSFAPSSHSTTLNQFRAYLIYAILTDMPLNVGELLHQAIFSFTPKKHGTLFFPGLITALCLTHDVPLERTDRRVFVKEVISSATVARLADVTSPRTTPAPSSSQLPRPSVPVHSLFTRFQAFAAWHRDALTHLAQHLDVPPLPPFPDHILTPPAEGSGLPPPGADF